MHKQLSDFLGGLRAAGSASDRDCDQACYRIRCMMSQLRTFKKSPVQLGKKWSALQPVLDLISVCSRLVSVAPVVAAAVMDDDADDHDDADSSDSGGSLFEVPVQRKEVPIVTVSDTDHELSDKDLESALCQSLTPIRKRPAASGSAVTPEKGLMTLMEIDKLIGAEALQDTSGPTMQEYKAAFKKKPAASKAALKRPAASADTCEVKKKPSTCKTSMRKLVYSKQYHRERTRLIELGMSSDEAKVQARVAAQFAVRTARLV